MLTQAHESTTLQPDKNPTCHPGGERLDLLSGVLLRLSRDEVSRGRIVIIQLWSRLTVGLHYFAAAFLTTRGSAIFKCSKLNYVSIRLPGPSDFFLIGPSSRSSHSTGPVLYIIKDISLYRVLCHFYG